MSNSEAGTDAFQNLRTEAFEMRLAERGWQMTAVKRSEAAEAARIEACVKDGLCIVAECGKKAHACGVCRSHYRSFRLKFISLRTKDQPEGTVNARQQKLIERAEANSKLLRPYGVRSFDRDDTYEDL